MMEVIRLHCSTMTDNFSVFAQKYYIFAIPGHLILLLFTVMKAIFTQRVPQPMQSPCTQDHSSLPIDETFFINNPVNLPLFSEKSMTAQQLEYIVALDTHRHFVTAAAACYVTQSTLSAQIHKLEQELNTILFDRSRQPVVPTAAGALIIEQARVALRELRKINDIVAEQSSVIRGTLTLGIIPTLAPYILGLFLEQFRSRYPEVQVQIEEETTSAIVRKLKHDQLDCALLATPLGEPSLMEDHVFTEPFVVYMAQSHPLLNLSAISPQLLQNEELVVLTEAHCFGGQMLNVCNRTDDRKVAFKAGSIETLKCLTDIGKCATLLPELSVSALTDDELLRVRPFTLPTPARTISVVYHRSMVKRNIIEQLQNVIREYVPQEWLNPQTMHAVPLRHQS